MFVDKSGILELPLRMVVTIVIGGVALATILSFILQPCLFPSDLQVSWQPSVIESDMEEKISVEVKNSRGNPISGATVLISGLGTASVNKTNAHGKTTLYIKATLPQYRKEGYLNIRVTVGGCYKKFYQENAIKVVMW